MLKKVGIIGWRGMVGSVLLERMKAEEDFQIIEPFFFSTSSTGYEGPDLGQGKQNLLNAKDINQLKNMDIILSCQGGDYTNEIYPQLRKQTWTGYWIDAASALRMNSDAVIILDPVNGDLIRSSLQNGIKNYIGGNCTVSLMLMALGGLFKVGAVEWLTSMTYQAASGAGANNMKELLRQMSHITDSTRSLIENPAQKILDIDCTVSTLLQSPEFPTEHFGVPLAGSLIPWIDKELENGQSKEEWKGMAETNKILGKTSLENIPIDGTCVRVGAMRCHSQGITVKLKQNYPLDEITDWIRTHNEWVRVVPNHKEDTVKNLSPTAVSGRLHIPVGRLRKMTLGKDYLNVFTCGDQLLWGAAEPLRRMLKIICDF